MPDLFTADFEGDLKPLGDDIYRGAHAAAVVSEANQRRIAEANQQLEKTYIEGVGQLVARIDHDTFFKAVHKWGAECWGDNDFLQHCLRKNPDMRVTYKNPKTRILRP